MAEIVNLRRVRKRLARETAAQDAAAARTLHGRTLNERQAGLDARCTLGRVLDQARLEPSAGTALVASETTPGVDGLGTPVMRSPSFRNVTS